MNNEIKDLREELSKVNRNGSVPKHKAVVTTSNYEIVFLRIKIMSVYTDIMTRLFRH